MQGRMYYSPHGNAGANNFAASYKPSSLLGRSEQSLIDEVRLLHSLWRQGPPAKRTRGENTPERDDQKRVKFEAETENKKKKKNKNKKGESADGVEGSEALAEPINPGEEAAVIDDNWNPESQWDTENPSSHRDWKSEPPKTEAKSLTEEEQTQFANLKLQQKAARAFKEFLTRGRDDESTSGESEDDEVEDEDDDEEGDEGSDEGEGAQVESGPSGATSKEVEAQRFFEKLFDEDEEVRKLYEQNCNCGAFECLVCAAVGAKVGKKFSDCVGLVQHAMKILRTKKKAAHRGYGRAVCFLLGWNAQRLPSSAKPLITDLKPRACIPPPDELEAEGSREGDNEDKMCSDGEAGAAADGEVAAGEGNQEKTGEAAASEGSEDKTGEDDNPATE